MYLTLAFGFANRGVAVEETCFSVGVRRILRRALGWAFEWLEEALALRVTYYCLWVAAAIALH